jgi:hypothetical protein
MSGVVLRMICGYCCLLVKCGCCCLLVKCGFSWLPTLLSWFSSWFACPSPPWSVLLHLAAFFSFRWPSPWLAGPVGGVVVCSRLLWPSRGGEWSLSPPLVGHCCFSLAVASCCGVDNSTHSHGDWAACVLPGCGLATWTWYIPDSLLLLGHGRDNDLY